MIFLKVWFKDGADLNLSVDEKSELLAALAMHVQTGEDSLIFSESFNGAESCFRISQVVGYCISTPQQRARGNEIEEELKGEGEHVKPDWL